MSGQAGVWPWASSHVYLLVNLFSKLMLPLFFSRLLLYLVRMKRGTCVHVSCKRDNSHFLSYVLISPDVRGLHLLNPFSKLYVTFILQWIAFIFGRDEEEDQCACLVEETTLTFSVMYLSPLTS